MFFSRSQNGKKWALGLQSVLVWVKDFVSFTLVWIKSVCLYFCDDCSSTDPFRLGSFKWNEMHDSNPLLHQSFVCGSVGYSSNVRSLWAELSSEKSWQCGSLPRWFTPPCLMHIFSILCYLCSYFLSSLSPFKSGEIVLIHLTIYLPPALHFSGASLVIKPLHLKISAPSLPKKDTKKSDKDVYMHQIPPTGIVLCNRTSVLGRMEGPANTSYHRIIKVGKDCQYHQIQPLPKLHHAH